MYLQEKLINTLNILFELFKSQLLPAYRQAGTTELPPNKLLMYLQEKLINTLNILFELFI